LAGWETGRRPLSSVQAGRFVFLQSVLIQSGAAPRLVRLLPPALEADQVLDHAAGCADRRERGTFHPLGASVYRRQVFELIAWPLSGRTPAALAQDPETDPGPPEPEPPRVDRTVVFDHLRIAAETAGDDSLLHRQALYLQSYDQRPDAAPWMADQFRRHPRRRSGWAPGWPVTRTLAAGLARYGNRTPLAEFSEYGLADDPGVIANLNYWAYWVGETPVLERDDAFMPRMLGCWSGDQILRHILPRLEAGPGVADLGIHTLRGLLLARPQLASSDNDAAGALTEIAGQLLDGRLMPASGRRALAEVSYALRTHSR
jgi:hypothetical protein